MDRRAFLIRAALGTGLLMGSPWLAAACRSADAGLARRLAACAPPEAAALGRSYTARHPDEANPLELARALAAGWSDAEREEQGERLCARLRRQNRDDFEAGRVVTLGGFVLGRTEARLAALSAA